MAATIRDHGVEVCVPEFVQMNNLACESVGGKVLFATDDWFAAAENLLKKSDPEFKVGLFTEYGKWMDGWETRRKRIPGHDWCIIELGVPGIIYGFHVDTQFFTGNYAPQISVQAACLQPGKTTLLPRGERIGSAASEEDFQIAEQFKTENWDCPFKMTKLNPGYGESCHHYFPVSLLKMTKLNPGYGESCHHYFPVSSRKRWTHVRLNIYPDGGIARFKVYGIGQRDWTLCGPNNLEDLLSMTNGGVCLGFSDAHYGHPRNLIGKGRAADMGDGWETARRLDRPPIIKVDGKGILQVPGNEWTIFRLGHPGLITHIEIDTNHFKGNAPNSCKIEASVLTPKEEEEKIKAKWDEKLDQNWKTLLPITQLQPHKRHFIEGTLISLQEVVTHVRVTIAPDGGVSRVRLWGFPRQLS
ncbi:PREDICTED: LOW QUALITY PROTEIN: probable allantoicase [Nanorana parkeri]|uniref:LOW QUALITY PROTEIN: probable allantoicase n=1 Tax=Nanorana parkeri TaxID=125878 RepID=UPI0008545BF3|nr:PREDICTED: LOW QUALITY PROTEIN: probable allantoicase [Nanorana parkeri]